MALHMIERMVARRMFWLLVALLLVMVLSPIVEMYGHDRHRLYLVIINTILMISAMHAASANLRGRIVGVGLAVAWVLLAWFKIFSGALNVAMWADVALMILLFYVLAVLIARTVRLEQTDFDSLCGAVATYFLIAATWAVSYRVMEVAVPGSFSVPGDAGASDSHWLYFSLTTITTVGYGDITPVTPLARIWSTLEGAAGVLYVALLIARLMSLYRR